MADQAEHRHQGMTFLDALTRKHCSPYSLGPEAFAAANGLLASGKLSFVLRRTGTIRNHPGFIGELSIIDNICSCIGRNIALTLESDVLYVLYAKLYAEATVPCEPSTSAHLSTSKLTTGRQCSRPGQCDKAGKCPRIILKRRY
jgi:hypothetical protein